jgi:hypothetical protein
MSKGVQIFLLSIACSFMFLIVDYLIRLFRGPLWLLLVFYAFIIVGWILFGNLRYPPNPPKPQENVDKDTQ